MYYYKFNIADWHLATSHLSLEEEAIYLAIADRHPVDILRTLAHELTHFKQFEDGKMYAGAGETGSPIENEAHALAGIVMRHLNKKHPEFFNADPVKLP